MRLKLIGEFPEVLELFELALEGKIYMKDAVFMNRKYKETVVQIANIIAR